jgi:hypothetical protein
MDYFEDDHSMVYNVCGDFDRNEYHNLEILRM